MKNVYVSVAARGNIVRGNMSHAGRALLRDPTRPSNFFNLPNNFFRAGLWDFIQPLTEMNTRSRKIMFLGRKAAVGA
jgi:hypothetical protein